MTSRCAPGLLMAGWLVLSGGFSSAFAGDLLRPGLMARGHAVLSEVRMGLTAQDPVSPERGTVNLSGLILFNRPFQPGGAPAAFMPLPHLGYSLNLAGKTSHLHAGLTWRLDLTRSLFVEASLGGALHDGVVGRYAAEGRNALGCRALFREAASLGYRLENGWTITATVEHLSNGGRCDANRGLTNVGVMLGYQF
jgi:lipid A 3-O-deacylase